jgi:sodium-dependent dicarboxylate transporter 2/3/5
MQLRGAHDSSVALVAVIAMFLIPNGEAGRLLDWKTANKIPWGLLLLFAGGIAIGVAFTKTGLSDAIGQQLSGLKGMPVLLVMLAIALLVTFLTEVTSNTATTNILMPILAATAGGVMATNPDSGNIHLVYMFPAVISASCAFMLPVATAPNAVIYGSEMITIQTMIRKGFILNIIGAVIISLLCYFWVV